MGLLKFLFIALLLFFPSGNIVRFEPFFGIVVTLNDIGVGFLVIAWLLWHLCRDKGFTSPPLTKPIFIFGGICFISLIVNSRNFPPSEFVVAFLYFLRWVFYAGIYFVVNELNLAFKNKIPGFMILAGLIVVIGGYIQYFFYPSLRNLYYLGWDEHLYRMFSSFLDPNFAGAFFVLDLLLILGLFFSNLENKKIRRGGLGLGMLGLLTLGAVFLTYSRSALLMFLVGISTFLIMKGRKQWLFAVFLLSLAAIILLPKSFRSEGTNFLRTVSSMTRISSVEKSLLIFRDNPILGVGFNTYRYAQRKYGFLNGSSWETSHAGAGTDNSFLFVAGTTGIIGFTAYVFLWFRILQLCLKDTVLFSSSLALFFGSLFINSLFYPFIMMWMWILAGLMENR